MSMCNLTDNLLGRTFQTRTDCSSALYYNQVNKYLNTLNSYISRHCSLPKYRIYTCKNCGSIQISLSNHNRKLKYFNLCPVCACKEGRKVYISKRIQRILNEVGQKKTNLFYNEVYPALTQRISNPILQELLDKNVINVMYALFKSNLLNETLNYKSIYAVCFAYLVKANKSNKKIEVNFSDLSRRYLVKFGLDSYMEEYNGK